MKKIILSAVLSICSFLVVSAQLSIPEPNLTITGSANTGDIYGYTDMVNDTQDSLNLRWVRTINAMPGEWDNYFCAFPGECGLPWTDSLNFFIAPGTTSELQCHCEPNDVPGIADITVRLINNETDVVLGTINITCDAAPVSTNELEKANIKLFPNPTTDKFQLVNANKVDEVFIYNILGREVKYFGKETTEFSVGDLAKGIYLVKLVDRDTEAIKTLRLKKN